MTAAAPARACYYVSAIDGPRKYLIAGPYPSHDAALAKVQPVRDAANERDPRAWFMAWGTCGSDAGVQTPMGVV